MEKKPIKSNLFRFVTLRSPQAIDESKKFLYFVTYPSDREDDSEAHVAARSATTEEEKVNALKGAYSEATFTPIENTFQFNENPSSFFDSYGVLYQFSKWLMRNKYNLSKELVTDNLNIIIQRNYAEAFPSISDLILTTDEEVVIWNNLFYQTINKVSASVREALIQILVANNFLKHSNLIPVAVIGDPETALTIDNSTLSILANASVVIPKEVLYTKKDLNNTSTSSVASSSTTDYIRKVNAVERAQEKIATYETALKELERAQVVYTKEEEKAYQQAVQDYEQQVATITSGDPVIVTVTDPDTGETTQIETYPDLEGLQVNYTKSDEFIRVDDGTAGKSLDPQNSVYDQLSSETQSLINSPEFIIYDTFSEVISVLQQNINNELQVISDNSLNTSQTVTIGGETVSLSASNTELGSTFGGNVSSLETGNQVIVMWFKIPNARSLFVTDANYELKNSADGTVAFSGVSVQTLERDTFKEDMLHVKLFTESVVLGNTSYKFSGELTLNNGQIISFSNERDVNITDFNSRQLGGIYEFIEDSGSTNEEVDTNVYGVTQLGIADFRRVEQEVCCYVPGEVSHIENVMAREYKERTTRNLRVSDVTSERSSEREVENLTDTTTTERNEMQSETSSIIDEDTATSFGANASYSGFGLSLGTSFNTTSGSATSNSNLQAQNYAKEVTERALERVVEKVSTKRTSRILKEFEENNTHGFDNRKGDEHVTGVYRWVDIKYKNTLVNYGKRLMYEFAIPEPAKFYVDKYLNFEGTGGNNNSDLIIPDKPIHPSKTAHKLLSSKDISEGNYQSIASMYNADVSPSPIKQISVSKGFDSNYYKGGKEAGYYTSGSDEIIIPDGYQASSAKASVSFNFHHSDREYPSYSIHVGGKSVYKNNIGLSDDQEIPSFGPLGNVQGSLGVSFESYDTGTLAITIAVNCTRTKESYEQWQIETYNAILEAYNERVQEYNEFQNQDIEDVEEEKQREFSSQLNRGIEKREIKRIAINLMTAPFKNLTVSKSHYKSDSITINNRKGLEQHASVVKFFEQAFDWEIMAYTFYPYFYKSSASWAENFDYLDGKDPIFKAFLQSGMARAVVPVRPGFEYAVNWFMETGEIWNGESIVTDINDDLYLSIAEELQSPLGQVEGDAWETRVPTSLTILQADSVVLDEGGLPCKDECNEGNTFTTSNIKLGDGTTQDGVDFDIVSETNTVV